MKVFIIDSSGHQKTLNEAKLDTLKNFKYLIALKKHKDTLFEKWEYSFNGPLMTITSYHDSLFSSKEGKYFEYSSRGIISKEGQFLNNKKEGTWFIYDERAQPMYTCEYFRDNLIGKEKIINPLETLSEGLPAHYNGGDSLFSKMIGRNFEYLVKGKKLKHGGYASVRFMIDTLGKMKNLHFSKSCNFVFDEACVGVINSIPDNWIPAILDGKKINSYREQPLGVKFKDNLPIN